MTKRTKDEDDKKPAAKSNLMLFVVLGVGGVALLGCCLLGGVLGVVFWPKGAGLGGGGGISKENWQKVKPGQTRAEIEAALGGSGAAISGQDANQLVTKGANNVKPIPGTLLKRPDCSFTVWRDGGNHVLVGFFNSKKYGDLCTYAHLYLDLGAGKVDINTRFENPEFAEGIRERQEKDQKFLADPKWKKGQAARDTLIGSWGSGATVHLEFNRDGTMRALVPGPNITTKMADGTYKFLDDDHIEMNYPNPIGAAKNAGPVVRKILVADDEINVITEPAPNAKKSGRELREQHRRIKKW